MLSMLDLACLKSCLWKGSNRLAWQDLDPRKGVDLVKDPVHGYLHFTKPLHAGEVTEAQLIDSPWLQRLRRIRQLQSAYVVYPAADHTRLAHSLSVMELAGQFAKRVYPRLRNLLPNDPEKKPEVELVVETFRIAGLLHDIGHGPFSHLFDEVVLEKSFGKGFTHEDVTGEIVRRYFAPLIRRIRRSPYGTFEGEIDPDVVCKLIKRGGNPKSPYNELRPIMSGPYDADKMDFLLRDSLLTGEKGPGLADIHRLMETSIATPPGPALRQGVFALHDSSRHLVRRILRHRIHLFMTVYYHRTARAFEFLIRKHLARATEAFFPLNNNGRLDLEKYQTLDEVSLGVRVREHATKYKWCEEFLGILDRELPIRLVYEASYSDSGQGFPLELLRKCKDQLCSYIVEGLKAEVPQDLLEGVFIDMPFLTQPLSDNVAFFNPLIENDFHPISFESLLDPVEITLCRVYAPKAIDGTARTKLLDACRRVFPRLERETRNISEAFNTNC